MELNTQEEGSSSCRSSSSPSLGPSPVLPFLEGETNERQEDRESSFRKTMQRAKWLHYRITREAAFPWQINITNKKIQQNTLCNSVKWQQQGDGKRKGCSVTSNDGDKQELSSLRWRWAAQQLGDVGQTAWQTGLHKVLPEWGVKF